MSDISMTTAEQNIADDKMRAEIAKLIAETSKINAEARWYPLAIGTGPVSRTRAWKFLSKDKSLAACRMAAW